MTSSTAVLLRRLLFQIHLWTGLILCIPLVVLGLTGVVLTWPDAINRAINPPPHVAMADRAGLPPSAYVSTATAAAPGARLQSLKLPQVTGDAVAVSVNTGRRGPGGGRTVWLDPASATLIKVAPATFWLFAASHDLHGSFMVPGPGRSLVGVAGFAMLLLSLTGLWVWWPRRGGFVAGLRWRQTPDALMNLHHQIGFWISIPLAVVSITGILICFPQLMGAGGHRQGPEGPPRGEGARGGGARLSIDQAVAIASARRAGATLASVSFPGAGGHGPAAAGPPAWRIEFEGPNGAATVRVDDATGDVLAGEAPRRGGQGTNNPMGQVRAIHEGERSALWRWIVTLTGLLPLLLAATGVYYWAKLELRKARAARP